RALLQIKGQPAQDTVAAYRKALELFPRSAAAHFAVGQELLAIRDTPGGLAALRQTVRIDPKHVMAYCGLGATLMASGRTEDLRAAVEAYSKAIAIDPNYNGAWCQRGFLHRRLGQRDKALDDFSRAIALVPLHGSALFGRAEIYGEMGQWDKALV